MKRTTDRDDVIARQEGRGLVSGNGAGESQALCDAGGIPDPEVEPRATRRRFSSAHKGGIAEEADSFRKRGAGRGIVLLALGDVTQTVPGGGAC